MPNSVVYPFSGWQPDSTTADSNHPIGSDPMNEGSSNAADGWVRLLESNVRHQSIDKQWEYWLGILPPYSPSGNAPVYISSTSFQLTGDWTSSSPGFYPIIAVVGRRVKAFTTGNPNPIGVVGTIASAVFGAGATTITVTWDATGIDATVSEVQFGVPIPGQAANPVPASFFGTASGTNTYTVTLATVAGVTPASQAALLGMPIVVEITNTNTGASTLNANGFGAQPITTNTNGALAAGALAAEGWYILVWDGVEYQAPGSLVQIRAYKATSQSSTSVTLANDNDLHFPIAANESWQFELDIYATFDTSAVGGLVGAFTVPAGCTLQWANTQNVNNVVITSGGALTLNASTFPRSLMKIYGQALNGGTAGIVQFQWAQDVIDAVPTVLQPGCSLVATKLAP